MKRNPSFNRLQKKIKYNLKLRVVIITAGMKGKRAYSTRYTRAKKMSKSFYNRLSQV